MVDDVWVGARFCGDCWLSMAYGREGYDAAAVHDGVGDLWFAYEETAERIVVDVPIGLIGSEESPVDTSDGPAGESATDDGAAAGLSERAVGTDATADGERRCDRLARELLGQRGHTVVSPPARAAARKRRYPVANRVHERWTGEALSEAAFEMSDAVAVLDDLLGEFPAAREVFAAGHPELAFLAAADHPPEHDRDTAGGYAERMRALAAIDRDAPPAVQAAAEAAAGRDVTVADVLDAALLAYTALPREGRLRSLPPDPPLDGAGLPIRLVYRSETPLVDAANGG